MRGSMPILRDPPPGGKPATAGKSAHPKFNYSRYIEKRRTPGNPADFFLPLSALKPGDLVILIARDSYWTQELAGNLDEQMAKLRRVAEERGLIVVGMSQYVESGWQLWHLHN